MTQLKFLFTWEVKTLHDFSSQIKSQRFLPLSHTIRVAHSWNRKLLLGGGGDDLDILVLLLVGLAPPYHPRLVVIELWTARLSEPAEIAPGQ